MRKYEPLESRLVNYSVDIIKMCRKLPNSFEFEILKKQIIRSSTSASLNYGEVQNAESKKDFIHKLQIVLKELSETNVNLRIIQKLEPKRKSDLEYIIDESKQLLKIVSRSVITSKRSLKTRA